MLVYISYQVTTTLPSAKSTVFLTFSTTSVLFVCLFLSSKRRVFDLFARVSMVVTLQGFLYSVNKAIEAQTPYSHMHDLVGEPQGISLAWFVIIGGTTVMYIIWLYLIAYRSANKKI
ncbi:hypothetical protein Hanom_Chr03g00185401 [Helianthus anomalus]